MSGWGEQMDNEPRRYQPPHLRGGPAPPPGMQGMPGGYGAPPGPPAGYGYPAGGGRGDFGYPAGGRGGRGGFPGGGGFQGGGYAPRGGGFGGPPRGGGFGGRGGGAGQGPWPASDFKEDPFAQDDARKAESDAVFGTENTGINFDAYEDIPVETSGDNVPPHVDTFEELQLHDALMSNIRRCKYTKPTPVQKYAIPIGLGGRDMMACAQTGSGKTAAFCFPIIARLLKTGYQPSGRNRKALPAALILAPTRELTSQIYDEARKFSYQTMIRPVVIYGGAPVVNQVRRQQWSAAVAAAALCAWAARRWIARHAGPPPHCAACGSRAMQPLRQPSTLRSHTRILTSLSSFVSNHPHTAARHGARLRHPGRHARPPERPD